MDEPPPTTVAVAWLLDAVTRIFIAQGFSDSAAHFVADNLVRADAAGVPSHGAMLVPMYIDRLRAGSVSMAESAEVVADHGAMAVLDGKHALGQLTARQAMSLTIAKAHEFGLGLVTVRHAFHFGRAAHYADMAAQDGCIGIAISNTRPLMPAVGGAEPVVGNNPLAVAVPSSNPPRLVLDMALSEVALGKIRLAAAQGRKIPETWATDANGLPTTDPAAAIDGMLLPTGGPKGLGLALVVDVLTGVLSGGAYGNAVAGLYADLDKPNDCAHTFMAIDVGFVDSAEEFDNRMSDFSSAIVQSRARPDVQRVRLPGEPESERTARSLADGIPLESSVLHALTTTAAAIGAELPALPEMR
ncbi:MAG: Ldh family oxidoreductase [Beutenbergiaceae bacterium]